MKRLVVCCDGTWNDSDNGTDYTNVATLAWAIRAADTRDGRDIAQIVYYQSGVGSAGDLAGRITSGALGLGLSHNMRDAYAFICNNYLDGDEIFLFGFSRGAYTARCVGGLIGFAGLIGKRDLGRFAILWKAYKEKDAKALATFDTRVTNVPIKCIGVWDTVGSVGIPEDLSRFDLLFKGYYGFFDTSLGARVQHAFHAMALDERRKNFVPTLWTQTPEGKAAGQELKQVWFAGVHCDVGGGYSEHGSSDIPLAWMASQVLPHLAIDFDTLKIQRDVSRRWALGELHETFKDFWIGLGEQRRTPFVADQAKSFEKVHASVADRMKGEGVGADGKPYASAVLKPADMAAHNVDLSALEASLRWADADVKLPTAVVAEAKSFSLFSLATKAAAKVIGITS